MVGTSKIDHELRKNINKISSDLTAYWRTQTIHAGVELGIFDLINKGFDTITDLALNSKLPMKSTTSIVKGLVSINYLSVKDEKIILTPLGRLLTKDHEFSMTNASKMWSQEHFVTWQNLSSALRQEKEQFSKEYSYSFFNWLKTQTSKKEEYYSTMDLYARKDYMNIVEKLPIENGKIILDLGGGIGTLADLIVNNFKESKVIVFDLPEIESLLEKNLRNKTIKFISGDFFTDNLPKADCIILSRIIHDWDDVEVVKILKNCKKALNEQGRILILDHVFKNELKETWGALLQLNMLVINGGKERTLNEFSLLFEKADLEIKNLFTDDDSNISIIELDKRK